MLRVALKGLAGRKLRAMLTAFAVVLGVAMVSGTFVLTDTIKAGFGSLFTSVYAHTDVVISGRNALGSQNDNNSTQVSFPETLLAKVRAVPGVLDAQGSVGAQGKLVGHDGKVISHGFAPGLAFSVHGDGDQRFNPLVLTAGRFPVGDKEIAIDTGTASRDHYAVGDAIGAVVRGKAATYTIVGLAKLANVGSIGGATMAIFDFPTAQRVFEKLGHLDQISVAAKAGVTPQVLAARIRGILPPTAQVRTGSQEAAQQSSDAGGFVDILGYFLLAFGGIALFVGSFVIANTLSITIAQRAREFGTLRTIGATRRQLLVSVLVEGFVIGVLASVTGLFVGLGLAQGLHALFDGLGIELPAAGTVFATRTIVLALVLGTLVTLLASLFPAIRATRVEPIQAVREGVLPASRLARFGLPVALLVSAVAAAALVVGAVDDGLKTKYRLILIGGGVLLSFVGMALLAPRFVPPLARALGAPGAAAGGAAGSLARENAMRNPARTASTAAALMIGLALVTLVGVLAAGLKLSFEQAVDKQFVGDYALTSQNGFTPTDVQSERTLTANASALGITAIAGVRAGDGKAFGKRVGVTGVPPNVQDVIHITWVGGGPSVPAGLGADGAFVSKTYAEDHHLAVGSGFDLLLPTSETLHLTLKGIYDPPKGGAPFGTVTISQASFDRHYLNPNNLYAFVKLRGGVTTENTARLTAALKSFPDAKVQSETDFKHQQEQGLNTLLNLLYVLLSLSIVVSLFGIVNTLILSVFERTRELGMLRAVGMTRRQVRRMIRYESVITALIGAALGIPLGIVLALLVGSTIGFFTFTVPIGTVLGFIVAAIIVGLFAAIFPARRASRLNVLNALQYE